MSVDLAEPGRTPAGDLGAGYRVYPYRWVVIGAFMFVNLTMQMLWISYASVDAKAARFYGVSHLEIGLLAMLFMVLFIPMALPAAWLIDTRGFRTAVGAGALLMGICAIARGLAGSSYAGALAATVGIALAQPFLLNAWTKVPANWFAPTERATGVALATLANLVGIAVGEALTPVLVKSMSISSVQLTYGLFAMASALCFVLLAREHPRTPPCPRTMEVRALMLDGLRHALRVRPFLVYLAIWFAGMGIFNGVLTWVEDILRPRGFTSTEAGLVGALVLLGGVIGSVAVAPVSDRRRQRVPFMLGGVVLAVPCLVGLTFAASTWLLYTVSFALGFFLISVAPIGMQYAAEVTQPTPEGTSQGVLQLVGQCSVVLVYLMTALKTSSGSYTPSLLFGAGLLVVAAFGVTRLKEPAAERERAARGLAPRRPPVAAAGDGQPHPRGRPPRGRPPRGGSSRGGRPMRRTSIVFALVGIVFLAGAGVVRFAVAPAVSKLPADSNTTITLQGTAPVLLDQNALAPGSTAPLQLNNLPLTLRQQTRVLKANDTAAVVEYLASGNAAGHEIPGFDDHYAVDRRTLGPSTAISAPGLIPARGITVSFPIGTEKHDYIGWVQDTWTTSPLHFAGTATSVRLPTAAGSRQYQFGFPAYVFTQSIPPTQIVDRQELSELPAGVPKSQAAAVAGALQLPESVASQLGTLLASLPDPVPLAYTYSGKYTYWVAPRDGMVLDIEASETRTVELPASVVGTAVPLTTASQFLYSVTPGTLLARLHDAKNNASALTLIETTLPLTALALGVVCLVVAALTSRHRGGGRLPPGTVRPVWETPPERPRVMAGHR